MLAVEPAARRGCRGAERRACSCGELSLRHPAGEGRLALGQAVQGAEEAGEGAPEAHRSLREQFTEEEAWEQWERLGREMFQGSRDI